MDNKIVLDGTYYPQHDNGDDVEYVDAIVSASKGGSQHPGDWYLTIYRASDESDGEGAGEARVIIRVADFKRIERLLEEQGML